MNGLGIILIIISSFFFTGIIIRTKSIFSGRKGPGIFQPIKDIWRLLRKGSVYSETSSFIFKIAPIILFCINSYGHYACSIWKPKRDIFI